MLKPHKNKTMDPVLRKRHWEMLAAWLAGEKDDRRKDQMNRWLDNPGHARFFEALQADWVIIGKAQREVKKGYTVREGIRQQETIPGINPINQPEMKNHFDVDRAWHRLYERIQENDDGFAENQTFKAAANEPAIRGMLSRHPMVLRIAASVLIMAAATLAVFFPDILPVKVQKRITATTGLEESVREIILPDGSTVYLNSATRLVYPRSFSGESRRVELTGEAFFEVKPDDSKPFLVSAQGALVRVVGTSFSVNAREDAKQVEVYVENGTVRLAGEAGNTTGVLLEAGCSGTYSDKEGASSRPAGDRNSIAWKTREMVFSHTPLSEALETIGDVYKVKIMLENPETGQTFITGEFSSDPLEEVLDVICIQNHLTVEKSDNIIYLSPV